MLDQFQNLPKLENCNVAIIGLGYVGLPLAIEIAKIKKPIAENSSDNMVIGFDINVERIKYLKSKFNIENYNNHNSDIQFTNDIVDL